MTGLNRPVVLSIAGFDPCAGAGVLSDIKTFEHFGVYGVGANSALTFQNESKFFGLEWISTEQLVKQLDPLLESMPIEVAKIGLIESLETLGFLIRKLKDYNSEIKIIWDPIVKSSTGFVFHPEFDSEVLKLALLQISLITPNRNEIKSLANYEDPLEGAKYLSQFCPVLLKGGHAVGSIVTDYLFENENIRTIEGQRLKGNGKHGSGCVLSAGIAAKLALGYSLLESCHAANQSIRKFIASNDSLLGYHL